MGRVASAIQSHVRAPRVLMFDLERLPGEYTADIWEPRDVKRVNYMHPDRWTKKPSILCGSWKWAHEKRPGFVAAWESNDPHHVAKTFHALISDADIVIGFNHLNADMKWLQTDWLLAGIAPPRPPRHVDLYRVARRAFSLESKSLRHLCERLDIPSKSGAYSAAQAKAAAGGDESARRALRRYSVQDSVILSGVLDRLRPYITGVNLGLYYPDDVARCPACGGAELTGDGHVATPSALYVAHRCTSCGAVSRGARAAKTTPQRVAR